MACDTKIPISSVALRNCQFLTQQISLMCPRRLTKQRTSPLPKYRNDTEPLIPQVSPLIVSQLYTGTKGKPNIPSAIKEKNAPNQSIVKKTKSIPTTRPLLFKISNGTGTYPTISNTAATTPTSATGHETPRLTGPRITSINKTSTPAKKMPIAVVSKVVVQMRHL